MNVPAGIEPGGESCASDVRPHTHDDVVIDESTLPPSQYLMMEVLAARRRVGEIVWTFPSKLANIAHQLESKGLVQWKSGIAEHTILVWLTDAGRNCCLSPTCTAPTAARQ